MCADIGKICADNVRKCADNRIECDVQESCVSALCQCARDGESETETLRGERM